VIKAQITKSVFRPHHTFTIARLPTRGFRGTARRMERVGQQNGLVFARRGETFLRSAIFLNFSPWISNARSHAAFITGQGRAIALLLR
jgi:hypothetical protein